MTTRLASLIFLDDARDVVGARRRHVRVRGGHTLADLFEHGGPTDDRDTVNGVTLVTPSAEHRLPAHGHAHVLAPDDMHLPVASLFDARAGRSQALRSDEDGPATNVNFPLAQTNVSFHRQLRVPDDGMLYERLYPTLDEQLELADAPNGGLLLPMAQCEALSLRFTARDTVAVKIGYGDRNVLTGERWVPAVLAQEPQNYVVLPRQQWVRGVKDTSGPMFRQFVAHALEEISDNALVDQFPRGVEPEKLHLEVYPLRSTSVWMPHRRRFARSPAMTPAQLGLSPGDPLCFFPSRFQKCPELTLAQLGVRSGDEIVVRYSQKLNVSVHCLDRKEFRLQVRETDTVHDVKAQLEAASGHRVEAQRLIYGGKQLSDSAVLRDVGVYELCEMYMVLRIGGGRYGRTAVASGCDGRILETVFHDDGSVDRFSLDLMQSVTIDIVSSLEFARLTGREMIPSPWSRETYEGHAVPWLCTYDADAAMRQTLARALSVRSIESFADESRPCAACGASSWRGALTPCRHVVCDACLMEAGMCSESESGYDAEDESLVYSCPVCKAHAYFKRVRFSSRNLPAVSSAHSLSPPASSIASSSRASRASDASSSSLGQSGAGRGRRTLQRLRLL